MNEKNLNAALQDADLLNELEQIELKGGTSSQAEVQSGWGCNNDNCSEKCDDKKEEKYI